MDSGDPGETGLYAHRPVVEEYKNGDGFVIHHQLDTAVFFVCYQILRLEGLMRCNQKSVTANRAQVTYYLMMHYY